MNQYIQQLKNTFSQGNVLNKIIIINVVVYIFININRLILFLFRVDAEWLNDFIDYISVPSNMKMLLIQPWSIFTYMFVHVDFMHILFNMLILFWTGSLLEYLGGKKLLSTFILGGLSGAIFYILSYNLFPAFTDQVTYSSLIGASAGVLAVLTAVATLLPDYQVNLLFFGPVKLKFVAIFSIALYAFSIPLGNSGGHIAHLGGALYGFIYVSQLKNGRDIAVWFNKITDLFSFSKKQKSKLKVTHKRTVTDHDYQSQLKSRQEQIDQILDKISQSGYDSLSKVEKEILFNASKNKT